MLLNWPVSSPTSSLEVTGTRWLEIALGDLVPWRRDRLRIGRSSERVMK